MVLKWIFNITAMENTSSFSPVVQYAYDSAGAVRGAGTGLLCTVLNPIGAELTFSPSNERKRI